MAKTIRLGDLERTVMDQLWSTAEPQTARQVQEALSARREFAYTTILTVLHRLAGKGLVRQIREERAHRYASERSRDQLVAELLVDALAQAGGPRGRRAALVHFVERVGADEVDAIRRGLAELEASQRSTPRAARRGD
jgi:predicted transcriptional regulator